MAEYLEDPGPWMPCEAGHVFVWYDGPVLFKAKLGPVDIIVMAISSETAEDSTRIDYIAWEMDTSLSIIRDFVADRIDLRDLMLSEKVRIFEIGVDPTSLNEEYSRLMGRQVRRVMEEDIIPDAGVFWSDYLSDAPSEGMRS